MTRLINQIKFDIRKIIRGSDALLIVDPQKCFCPGGPLAVPEGDQIFPLVNELTLLFQDLKLPIFISRDQHPPKTTHFKIYGGKWPVHGVKGTPDAEFHDGLFLPSGAIFINKGMGEDEEGYSSFDGVDGAGNSLEQLLRSKGVTRLFICGLATDYCVKETVLRAMELNFEAVLVTEAIRAVNVTAGDGDRAIAQMQTMGATLV